MTSPYADEQPMPANATRNMFLWASGFGIGALLVIFAFVFLVGIGQLGHPSISGPSAAGQSASTAPAAPGPAPKPAPQTGLKTDSAQPPAPAQETTGRAPTREDNGGQAPSATPSAPAKQAPTPGPNKS